MDTTAPAVGATPLRQLVYSSLAARTYDTEELVALLNTSRRHNREAGVTGLLIYHREHFIQCLEGAPAAVEDTFSRIRFDIRHRAIEVLRDEFPIHRTFGGWAMACTEVTTAWWLEMAAASWGVGRREPLPAPMSTGFDLMKQAWDDAVTQGARRL